MNHEAKLEKYARLLVGLGVNLQKGQYLLLDIDAENYELARVITREAMARGAADVVIHWSDWGVDRERAAFSTREGLDKVEPWETESYRRYIDQGACSLRIIPAYPTAFDGVDPAKAGAVQRHSNNTRNILRQGTAEKICTGALPRPRRSTGRGIYSRSWNPPPRWISCGTCCLRSASLTRAIRLRTGWRL